MGNCNLLGPPIISLPLRDAQPVVHQPEPQQSINQVTREGRVPHGHDAVAQLRKEPDIGAVRQHAAAVVEDLVALVRRRPPAQRIARGRVPAKGAARGRDARRLDRRVARLGEGRRLVQQAAQPAGIVEHAANDGAGAAALAQALKGDLGVAATFSLVVPVVAPGEVLGAGQGVVAGEVGRVHAEGPPDEVAHEVAEPGAAREHLGGVGHDHPQEVAVAKVGPGLGDHGQVAQRPGQVGDRGGVAVVPVPRPQGLVVPGEARPVRHGVLERQVLLGPAVLGHEDKVVPDQRRERRPPAQAREVARVDEQRDYGCGKGLGGAPGIVES